MISERNRPRAFYHTANVPTTASTASTASSFSSTFTTATLFLPIFFLLTVGTARTDTPSPVEGPTFTEPIANVTVSLGREAVLACVVEDLLTYKVAWLRVDTQTILTIANHVITKNHRIAVTHSEHKTWYLHIRDVKESDRGDYMCQINTDPMKSQIGYLEVVVPPDIDDFLTSTDMVVRENSNVSLRCAANGSPAPNITWKREDGKLIALNNDQGVASIRGSALNISKVNRLHMGAYLCIASNGVPPIVSKRIMLIVHFAPMIEIQNQLVGAQEGQEITLECDSEAHPKSINYWMTENNDIITNNEKYESSLSENAYKVTMRLAIRSIEMLDYGTYKCISRNSLGETDGVIKLYHIVASTTQPKPTTTTPIPTIKRVEKHERSQDKVLSSSIPTSPSETAETSSPDAIQHQDMQFGGKVRVGHGDFVIDGEENGIGNDVIARDNGLRRIDNTAQSRSSRGATVEALLPYRAAICIIILSALT
ncbi:lachesin-like [Prorops nasuta]|uniref:lachesin-like n=1 Tax=Prorops nasuta TaxID=863751 RepID=UPI0034CE590A